MKPTVITCIALLTVTCAVAGLAQAAENPRTFHVSAASGDDSNSGLSPRAPWRSLDKVNAAELRPGDKVLFKRGDIWRGQLVPQSGKLGVPITYAAYGKGDRPLLLGSVRCDKPGDWRHEGGNIWATAKPVFTELETRNDLAALRWSVHAESGAKVRATTSEVGADVRRRSDQSANPTRLLTSAPTPMTQIECAASGTAGNHIQVYAGGFSIKEGDYYAFSFRARCTKPFVLRNVSLMNQSPPWKSYGRGSAVEFNVGADWTRCAVRFKATKTADDGRITVYLGGALPAGATFCFQPVSWKRLRCNEADLLSVDVGNIIFDHGKAVGVKKWKAADLKQPGDYWYDGANWQVKLYSEKNPAESHKSIELALRRHIISQGGVGHVVYENLAVSCGAAHGFGGGSTRGIVIRNCDISWIGGGHQFTHPGGRPVRFGNGIEFWSSARDCLVEGCRLWEIYDAALTNQGSGTNQQVNITYRDNVIWNSEYSFEYWNRGSASVTRNIRFDHNTCVNAGFGWGHAQRPDRNGRHLMFYHNPAQTSEFHVRDNIFCNATESALRMWNDWTAGLTMDRNCWFQRGDVLMLLLKSPFAPGQFAEFQTQSKLDAHSLVADPKFINADKLDFRLAPDSPARKLAAGGGPVGSRKRLRE
ncbi:MAG: right-handed parallel beta-helix repeat-containing protein [Verrucomicrobia bacterium]|nr:right-handed parallel beta-helix repeat-containing protein [Verrucomicrobiota bacterium]